MKLFISILCCFILSGIVKAEGDMGELAIKVVKNHPNVQMFITSKSSKNMTVQYHQMQLGGICGFAGCQWRHLVSVVLTAKSSNSPSTTIVALVEGIIPSRGNEPQVTFVELKPSDSPTWQLP